MMRDDHTSYEPSRSPSPPTHKQMDQPPLPKASQRSASLYSGPGNQNSARAVITIGPSCLSKWAWRLGRGPVRKDGHGGTSTPFLAMTHRSLLVLNLTV
jgi:hypothetical protein